MAKGFEFVRNVRLEQQQSTATTTLPKADISSPPPVYAVMMKGKKNKQNCSELHDDVPTVEDLYSAIDDNVKNSDTYAELHSYRTVTFPDQVEESVLDETHTYSLVDSLHLPDESCDQFLDPSANCSLYDVVAEN